MNPPKARYADTPPDTLYGVVQPTKRFIDADHYNNRKSPIAWSRAEDGPAGQPVDRFSMVGVVSATARRFTPQEGETCEPLLLIRVKP
jgi:hypothetical protein